MLNKIIVPLALFFMISCGYNSNLTAQLTNNDWEVISILNAPEFSKNPWMRFDIKEYKVTGNTGCNSFFGNIKLTNSVITFGTLGATKMMCADMIAEDALFHALNTVTSYKFENEKLYFFSNKKERIITLQTKTN